MKKGFKIALNIIAGAGVGAGGYFIGFKRGQKSQIEKTNEVIEFYENKQANQEQIVSEVLVKPEDLKPELLEQMEYGKADEVVITPEPLEEQVLEEVLEEEVVEEKPKKKSKRKTPYFIDAAQYAEEKCAEIDLEIDENGDVYDGESDDIYEDWTRIGTTIINKMVREHAMDKIDMWYIKDDRDDIVYTVTYRK